MQTLLQLLLGWLVVVTVFALVGYTVRLWLERGK